MSAASLLLTAAIAWPVLRAPSERIFGADIVGRHHDPFTVMAQFARPTTLGVYAQPVTDLTGAAIARVTGEVAAYNWLVLLSFPLSAAAAYLLARHLALPPAGALVASLLFAFSPVHLAHAAYHPHIAQTQWLPLYLLALWRCMDTATWTAIALLILATIAVTLSNFYGGLIAAVITPVAVGGYWFVRRPAGVRPTVVTLACLGVAGLAFVWRTVHGGAGGHESHAFTRGNLFQYSAAWWAYLVPPVAHPVFGGLARRIWTAARVHDGLLEQQVTIGWSVAALAAIGLCATKRTRSMYAPLLTAVALVALACSLSPEGQILGLTVKRPSALLYRIVPMFRAYARFGIVVQLMAALCAGLGVVCLLRAGTTRARIACAALLVLAAGEYAVSPSAMSRDVLPTAAHRWVTQQPDRMRVLDCTPFTLESASVPRLTADRVALLGGGIDDCDGPNLPLELAARGYTHLLVRRDAAGVARFAGDGPAPDGFRIAARFADGQVFAVTAPHGAIYTTGTTGLFAREHDAAWSWRWMGRRAAWTILNTGPRPVVATLRVELAAFHVARGLEVELDGRAVQTVAVEPARGLYELGPLTLAPGDQVLAFRPARDVPVAGELIDNGDRRRLSFALGSWHWIVRGEQP